MAELKGEGLSARQLGTAVLTAGLSWAGTQAGGMDWRWALPAAAAVVAAQGLLLRRLNGRALFQGGRGRALQVLYGSWGLLLLSRVLDTTAQRVAWTGGSGSGRVWIILLLTLPLLWMGQGSAAAFFRLTEILWLAMAIILAVLVLLMVPHVEGRYLFLDDGPWLDTALIVAEVFSPGVFVLPWLQFVERRESRRQVRWLSGLGLAAVGGAALTVGVLSPALSAQLRHPFFAAAGVLGKSARLEGLLSALWLMPDLALAGLLTRSWGAPPRPAAAAAVGGVLAATGVFHKLDAPVLGGGTLLLVILTFLLIPGREK